MGFLPAFTFTVADRGWTADFDDADVFQIVRPALDGFLSIGRGGGVITPGPNPQPQRLPDDLIAWIAGHPDLEAGEPVDTEIDGIRAVQIEVEARVDTQLFIRARSDEGVTIGTQQPPGVLYGLDSGALAKLTILEVEGARVVISIDGAPGTWDEFVALADAVVASIDFR
ncbi:MAG: hypothetical protein ACE5EV_01960 [Gaiellales bacterium]